MSKPKKEVRSSVLSWLLRGGAEFKALEGRGLFYAFMLTVGVSLAHAQNAPVLSPAGPATSNGSLSANAAPPSPTAMTVWDVVKTPGPERTNRLKEFAKGEGGSLSLYTSIAERDLKIIFDPFEKKYGIKVNVWRASGDSVLARTINEARGKRYTVDVFHAGAVG
jgi:hypothetical protein